MGNKNVFKDEDIKGIFEHWSDEQVARELRDRMWYYFGNNRSEYEMPEDMSPNVLQIIRLAVNLSNRLK